MNKDEFTISLRQYDPMIFSSCKAADDALSAVLKIIKSTLIAEGKVKFVGFGVFEVVDVPARQCRNPQNGEPITLPAHKAVRFRPGKELKEAVNRGQ
jgi:DNA-binding protein HU-beta|nr:HU family DNA-binding protein [Bilophila wadsworthia]